MKRIHIVGASPRTGTTLLAEAMKNCFKIDAASDHEDRLFTRASGECEVFLTKCPKDVLIVEPSLKADRDLYVICMIRDPRDIICSKHKKAPGKYWTGLKFWNTYKNEVDKIADHPRCLIVRYEELVSEPDSIQNTIMEHIPFLQKTNNFSSYHRVTTVSSSSAEALNGVRPISSKSVGRWRNHKERIAGQLKMHSSLARDLIQYDYEEDKHWIQELEGISPDMTPARHSGNLSFVETKKRTLGKYAEAGRRLAEQSIGKRIRITHPKKWFGALQQS